MISENNWKDFYEARINSTYQDYFEKRYEIMLDVIKDLKPQYILEEGIGIGSISKALNKKDIFSYGFDNNLDMLNLCQKNNPKLYVFNDCIIVPKDKYYNDLIVTHGVLEHFNDNQIKTIFKRYKENYNRNIHYVPLDGYEKPSFGDERLLSYKYWLNLVKPKNYILFNNNCDLLLIND